MTSSARSAGTDDKPRRGHGNDPGLLDELKCRAKGIEEQAKYNALHAKEQDDDRTAYEAARAAYIAARALAEPLVTEARLKLDDLVDRVRCQVDPADQEKLDRAYEEVVERLKRCSGTTGCCSGDDCDYDGDLRDCEPEDEVGLIADITRRTVDAQACFDELIKESGPAPAATPATTPAVALAPAAVPATTAAATAAAATGPTMPSRPPVMSLAGRVAALRKEIDDIATALTAATWEPAKLYAAVLVARRHLMAVWRGFATVNDYMDCLGNALACVIKGHAAVSELTRRTAVHTCYRESWAAACRRLAAGTVDEVLAVYLRLCAEEHGESVPGGGGYGGGGGGDNGGGGGGDDGYDRPEMEYGQPSGEDYGQRRPDRQDLGEAPPQRPTTGGGRPEPGYGRRPDDDYGQRPPDRPEQDYGDRPTERPEDDYGGRPEPAYGRPDDDHGRRPPDRPEQDYGDRPTERPEGDYGGRPEPGYGQQPDDDHGQRPPEYSPQEGPAPLPGPAEPESDEQAEPRRRGHPAAGGERPAQGRGQRRPELDERGRYRAP